MIDILLVDPNFAPSVAPIRTFLFIKIKGWQKKGVKVTLICSTQAKEFYSTRLENVEYITFNFRWRGKSHWIIPLEYLRANLLCLPFLFRVQGKFDIIYSLSSTLDIIFFPWLLKHVDSKIRWFSVMDNVVPKPSERPGNYILKTIPYLAFLISNIMLKKTDGIFVVTNILKEYYEKKGLCVIKTGTGNGLDLASFKSKVAKDTPKFSALFGARLHPAKGIYDLLEIMKHIVKKDKNFTLGIMGEGDEKTLEKLRMLIVRYKLKKNIYLLGHKNATERWDLYRSSGFFLFPSYAEGCPQVVLESFAANKLVLAYDLPEYRDALKKYISSGQLVLFQQKDYAGIAEYVQKIKNKKFVFHNKLEDFGWNKIVQKEYQTFISTQ